MKTVQSVTNPNAREALAAEFLLRMFEKYGRNIVLTTEPETEKKDSDEKIEEEER